MNQEDHSIQVECIIGHRDPLDKRRKKNLQYKVLWKGYTPNQSTWESADNLLNCKELVEQYHRKHPELPNPFKEIRPNGKPANANNDEQFTPNGLIKPHGNRKKPIERRKVRGRPPKNMVERVWEGPYTGQTEIKNPEQIAREMGKRDGYNVRMRPDQSHYDHEQNLNFEVRQVFAHPDTNQIFYQVKQSDKLYVKSRKYVMSKSKQALIKYYESLIVIKKQ